MIQEVGNVQLFELFETDTKTQCKSMPIILEWKASYIVHAGIS